MCAAVVLEPLKYFDFVEAQYEKLTFEFHLLALAAIDYGSFYTIE